MEVVRSALSHWPDYIRLEEAVKNQAVPAAVTGVSEIHKSCLLAALRKSTGRRLLLVAGDEGDEDERLGGDRREPRRRLGEDGALTRWRGRAGGA